MDLIYSTLYVLSMVAVGAAIGAVLLARRIGKRTGQTMMQVLGAGGPGEEQR